MKYRKLAPGKRGVGKWRTLWLGDDHLLVVESTGYSEDYTRYYLKDIQAIITRRSVKGKVLNAIFGIPFALLLLTTVQSFAAADADWVAEAVFAGLFLIMLIGNLLFGPTCRCYLRTPIGVEELPLSRVKRVKKMLDRLHPTIAHLQGELAREQVVDLARRAKGTPPPVAPVATFKAAAPKAEPGSSYRGGLHRAAFALLGADALVWLAKLSHNSTPLTVLAFLTTLCFLVLAVAALVKQNEQTVPGLAKAMVWGGIVASCVGNCIGYFAVIFLNALQLKGKVDVQFDLVNLYGAVQPASNRFFAWFIVAYGLVELVVAVSGLFAMTGATGTSTRRPR